MLGREPLGLKNIYAYFESIRYSKDYHGCFMINTLTEKHIVSPEAFETAKRFAKRAEKLFLANVKAAQEAGEIDANKDPVALAKFLTALDQGLAVYGIVSPRNGDKDAVVAQLDAVLSVTRESKELI